VADFAILRFTQDDEQFFISSLQACMDAFLFLKNKYPNKSIETARQDYLKLYHSEKINNYKDLAYAA